jgi:hypothetical protein
MEADKGLHFLTNLMEPNLEGKWLVADLCDVRFCDQNRRPKILTKHLLCALHCHVHSLRSQTQSCGLTVKSEGQRKKRLSIIQILAYKKCCGNMKREAKAAKTTTED